MQRLAASVWISFFSEASQENSSRRIQTLLRNFVQQETDGDVQTEASGVWVFLNSVQQAADLALSVMENLSLDVQFRVLLTVGDIVQENGQWTGEVLDEVSGLIKRIEVGQIWLTERFFHVMDSNQLAWDEIGMVSTEQTTQQCFRLLTANQCFVPPALKRALSEQKVLICQKGEDMPSLRKGKQVVLVGYEYDEELHALVARLNTVIANDRLWLVQPRLSKADRKQWLDLGRNLVIGDSDLFMTDVNRDDLTLIGQDANATMFLDPVSLASGELSLCGVALPKVPMARIIDGYTIDLLKSGEWGYGEESGSDVLLRVSVNLEGETVTALHPNCKLNSLEMEVNKAYPLGSGARISVKRLMYRYIADVGKPYQGLFLGEATRRVAISVGERVELGRQPSGGGFELPDRGGAERIEWASTPQAQSAKKNQLTLDRALTGRHHVALSIVSVGKFSIAPMHDKLPTFIVSQSSQHLSRVTSEQVIRNEGLIVVGTNVLKVAKT